MSQPQFLLLNTTVMHQPPRTCSAVWHCYLLFFKHQVGMPDKLRCTTPNTSTCPVLEAPLKLAAANQTKYGFHLLLVFDHQNSPLMWPSCFGHNGPLPKGPRDTASPILPFFGTDGHWCQVGKMFSHAKGARLNFSCNLATLFWHPPKLYLH